MAPEGYELDETVQTVDWNGKNDVTLTFKNKRKPTLIIYKCDEGNNYCLPGATFEVYKNGQLVTTATTNDNGLAYVSGVTTGYYTIKETVAPPGYVLDTKEYSAYVDVYDPATPLRASNSRSYTPPTTPSPGKSMIWAYTTRTKTARSS